jgi:hypothetical protein
MVRPIVLFKTGQIACYTLSAGIEIEYTASMQGSAFEWSVIISAYTNRVAFRPR